MRGGRGNRFACCAVWKRVSQLALSTLLTIALARAIRARAHGQANGRARLSLDLTPTDRVKGRSRRPQWPSPVAVVIGFGLCATSLFIRISDVESPQVSEGALDRQNLGLYLDVVSLVALSPVNTEGARRSNTAFQENNWRLELQPGKKVRATFTKVLLSDPRLWKINLNDEVRVIFTLPGGTAAIDNERSIRVGSDGTCASWYDGRTVHYAKPSVQRSVFGNLVVICTVPPVGDIQDLIFQITFEWEDETYTEGGYGRYVGGVRFEFLESVPSDINLPARRGTSSYFLAPIEFVLDIPNGARLLESFPNPSSGRTGERVWDVGQGLDVEYSVEQASARAWVQPATELSLLLAGVAFGLAPAFWRRRYH